MIRYLILSNNTSQFSRVVGKSIKPAVHGAYKVRWLFNPIFFWFVQLFLGKNVRRKKWCLYNICVKSHIPIITISEIITRIISWCCCTRFHCRKMTCRTCYILCFLLWWRSLIIIRMVLGNLNIIHHIVLHRMLNKIRLCLHLVYVHQADQCRLCVKAQDCELLVRLILNKACDKVRIMMNRWAEHI